MNLSKKVIVLLGFLITFSFGLFAQSVSNGQNSETINLAELSESEISIAPPPAVSEQALINTGRPRSTAGQFVRVVVILIIVVGLAYGILYLIKRRGKIRQSDDQFLRRVAYLSLSQGKSVEVVTLVNHAYVIGVSDGGINLISELDDPELVDALNLYSDKQKNTSKPKNFADVLDIFMPGGPRNSENVTSGNIFSSSEKNAEELLKKQRSKLKRDQNQE